MKDVNLAAKSGAGIKKSTKQKPMSRAQRLRKEKGIARADIVINKLSKKVDTSKGRAKKIKDRAVRGSMMILQSLTCLPGCLG